jgi:enoyl-CoA hydratase/carnithine racemase
MTYETIKYEVDEQILTITLNRPDKLNAFNAMMQKELIDAFDQADKDDNVRAIIVTGAGRGFCAGADLSSGADTFDRDARRGPVKRLADGKVDYSDPNVRDGGGQVTLRIFKCLKPVIAAVNGPATGGGLALALACDVRVAADSARFNVAFIRVGLSGCDIGTSYLLPRLVGASRAFELMLTGRMVDASEADRIGLVSRVVPDGQVVDTALETAELIRANSPFGVWMTKEVMWSNLEAGSLQAAIDLENRTQLLSSHTGDMREALAAFLEKRPPNFSGR